MRSLRYTIELGGGVKVEMLFTPHLYSFKGYAGIDFKADMENTREVFDVYADVMCCAALNAWVLDGHGRVEDFPHRRGDFHEFMASEPKEYGKALEFAVLALTGKTLGEHAESSANGEKPGKAAEGEREQSKKKARSWIGRLLRRS